MIPKRIKLSGFLCYKDEQEIGFDGSSLWMLSGLNGSGKSSIFDAVTYALFGHHRGGRADAIELVNKSANGLSVEFEFTIDGHPYQIRRTLRRRATSTAATQQIYRSDNGAWAAVPDTQRKAEFDAWVRDHIGLSYETFTSSVLLLQGRAEKLLDSTPKGRAEVLAGIVDLERYQKLHEKADGQRKTLRGKVEAWQGQLDALPEIDPFELAEVQNAIESAEEAGRVARDEVERLFALEARAKQWADLERRSGELARKQAEAAGLVKQAEAIERDLARLRELREVLPHVGTVLNQRQNLDQSNLRTQQIQTEQKDLLIKLGERDHALDGLKRKRAVLQKRLAEDEAKLQAVGEKLPRLSATLERIRQCDMRRADLARLDADLAKLPGDLPREVARKHQLVDELTALHQAQSPLTRLHAQREELRQAKDRLKAAQQAEQTVRTRGEELKRKLAELGPKVEAAERARRDADDRAASERALAQQARVLRDEFKDLNGAKTCRACGQPLTPKHFREEKARRDQAVTDTEERVRSAEQARAETEAGEKQFRGEHKAADDAIRSARDSYLDAKNALEQAKKDVAQHAKECAAAYAELADPFRTRVAPEPPADWLTAAYPSDADLAELRRRVSQLPAARQKLNDAQTAQQKWIDLNGQVQATRQALADLERDLPADPATVRAEFTRLEAEDKALKGQVRTTKQEDRSTQVEQEQATKERERLNQRLTELRGKIENEEVTRRHASEAVALAQRVLPEPWRERAAAATLAELGRWREEMTRLTDAGTEQQAEKLKQARIDAQTLKRAVADLEAERAAFPEDARRDPAAVQVDLQNAKKVAAEKANDLSAAQNRKAILENRQRQRANAQQELAAAELEHNRYKILTDLLGRDRLQRHLVRQAERQIVDYANAVLDRLSGGQLMLRLVGADDGAGADKALELEAYNRATGQAPINVAFLSGSQRFRVAVSLALGIGQYASRQHRPIESVIIDEGFGCLDRNGRQVMIQELQNLRGHLHCILLVSHQEEFAEAFANGYRFELADGSTRVTRFQK